VTFDATGTLFHSPRLGEIYSAVLARYGTEVTAEKAEALVHQVWREFDCSARPEEDRFRSEPGGTRGWWYRFVGRLCEHLERPHLGPFAVAELFDRFSHADAWDVFDEVPRVLDQLGAMGLRLGIISNWDERLPRLLDELDLGGKLDAVTYSARVGVEKPHPEIFLACLGELEVPPGAALHIGDSVLHDVEGAEAVGMQAWRVDRRHGGGDLPDLGSLPRRLSGPIST
jgi:putative hydrolase of the HAD superfamily